MFRKTKNYDPRVFAYSLGSEQYYESRNTESYYVLYNENSTSNTADEPKKVETKNKSPSCSPQQQTQKDEATSNLIFSM